MRYSNSYLESYKQCPLQCFFKNELKLEKVEEGKTEHHLVFGRAFHSALKRIYLGDTFESAKKALMEGYPVQLDPEDKAKTQANGLIALEGYVKRWHEEDKKWKVLSCEEKETFDYGLEENFTVVLDLVKENIQYGGVYGEDHKIVGGKKAYLNEEFWRTFEPNSQITKYTSFIKSKYGDCSGFYINGIGMGHRERAYKGEPAGFWVRYQRMMFNRSISHLEIEQKDTEYWIGRIEESKRTGLWGMNTNSCRFCFAQEICKAGWTWESDKELILINYKQAPRESKGESDAVRGTVSAGQTKN